MGIFHLGTNRAFPVPSLFDGRVSSVGPHQFIRVTAHTVLTPAVMHLLGEGFIQHPAPTQPPSPPPDNKTEVPTEGVSPDILPS